MDPITDIFRTMHVTAFGLHRLEATAPWGVRQEKQTEEKVTPSDKRISPTDLAHFAMLSRGNCGLSVEGLSLIHISLDCRNSYCALYRDALDVSRVARQTVETAWNNGIRN